MMWLHRQAQLLLEHAAAGSGKPSMRLPDVCDSSARREDGRLRQFLNPAEPTTDPQAVEHADCQTSRHGRSDDLTRLLNAVYSSEWLIQE